MITQNDRHGSPDGFLPLRTSKSVTIGCTGDEREEKLDEDDSRKRVERRH